MHLLRIISNFFILSLMLFSNQAFSSERQADDVLGFWLSESGRGVIEIYRSENSYEGKLVWIKDIWEGNKKVKLDIKNPNKALQNRALMQLVNLQDFSYKNKKWEGGKVYDPAKGKIYSSYMYMPNINTLKLRGYVGVALFGRTSVMTRQRSAIPDKYAN